MQINLPILPNRQQTLTALCFFSILKLLEAKGIKQKANHQKEEKAMEQKRQKIRRAAEKNHFIIDKVQELSDMKAVLYQMHYGKNGARLVWLDRREENKTFSITFKTLPNDNTGVFHILEHSLLCGSEKYPVSKPFVEMIKSSLQTFMNAFTFPDKTMYPVCSRNQKDFMNLMSVYLDAVFHPLCVKKKEIFQQEGWHYEMGEPEGELSCNGVVYNEMKGMYASPDTLLDAGLNFLLFPDNCYKFQSGGDPEHITDLTYQDYAAAYRHFYHPSNAYIILDGDMEIEETLVKLDEELGRFEKQEQGAKIPMQRPVAPIEYVRHYAVGKGEDIENKVLLAKGWVCGGFDEAEKNLACAALAETLCSSNDTPLKSALLQKGLAEDVTLSFEDGIQQTCFKLIVRNTSAKKKDEVWKVVQETLQNTAERGIDHRRLQAVLDRMEFNMREKEYGGFPEGIVNAMRILDSWLYGGDPAQNLVYKERFCSLREKIREGYFERLIGEIMLGNPHSAKIALLPSKTIGEKKREQELLRLRTIKETWTKEQKEEVIREFARLRKAQETSDSKEQLAALPALTLADIPRTMEHTVQTVTERGGNKILLQDLETDGIVHFTYYFTLADCTKEELSRISFLRTLLGQVRTEKYDISDIQAEIQGRMGRFEASADVFAKPGEIEECAPYLIISVSALEEKLEEASEAAGEVLNHSRFDDLPYIRARIRQLRLSLEQHILMAGDSYTSDRIASWFSARGAAKEAMQGIQMLRWVQHMDTYFEQEGEKLLGELAALRRRIVVRERMTLSVAGNIGEAGLNRLLHLIPEGNAQKEQNGGKWNNDGKSDTPKEERAVGIRIPAQVGFAGRGANLSACGFRYHGAMQVASRILSYGYLWNMIRVKGGAYGTRLGITVNGDVMFTSFRDPDVLASLVSFEGAGEALRRLCEEEGLSDRYIISTIASTEPLLTVRQKRRRAAEDYLSGMTEETRQKIREEILHTTVEDLLDVSKVLDRICENAGICVIGGKESLDAAEGILTQVESL